MKHLLICLAACIGLLLVAGLANAQMFGQNKPRYRTFDFKILETPHFSIYHYTKNKEAILRIADWSEEWYGMHSEMFKDSLLGKNPIIFYNNHAEFQQTNAISGEVGVSTGGVTEGLKNR